MTGPGRVTRSLCGRSAANSRGWWPCITIKATLREVVERGHAVNISVGLPLVRTSVAHGTAYDIVGKGIADERGLVEAARVATLLVGTQTGVSVRDLWFAR